MRKSKQIFAFILTILFTSVSGLYANPFALLSVIGFAASMPRPKYITYYQFEPFLNHKNSYFIVKINNDSSKGSAKLFNYSFSLAESFFADPYKRVSFSVVSTPSLASSNEPNLRDRFNQQIYIKDGCKNFFPIGSGEHFFWFHLSERKDPYELRLLADFSLTRYIHVEANQSIYIEVDIENDDYTQLIIDTPKDIFLDTCK